MSKWEYPKMIHGQLTKWNWLPYYPDNIVLGENVDIGAFTCLFAHYGIFIHKDVMIGSHVSIYSLNTENGTKGRVIIGEGAKIGAHTIIFPNVVIKKNEKIKANSIVYMKNGERIIK